MCRIQLPFCVAVDSKPDVLFLVVEADDAYWNFALFGK
jgi:hypothetical protein